jgi:hypothetical protein
MSAIDGALDRVLERLEYVRRSGMGWTARCPAHEDSSPSLSVSEGADGRVLFYCHAGCDVEAIVAALDLGVSDLFPDGHDRGARRPLRRLRRADYSGSALHVANVLYALERLGESWQLQLVCACPYCGNPRGWLRASPRGAEFDCEGGCDSNNFVQALLGQVAREEAA